MPGHTDPIDTLVGQIYDCAVNPDGWPHALASLSDLLGCSYTSLHSFHKQPAWQVESVYHSPWDARMIARVTDYLADIPALDELVLGPLDNPIATLQRVPFEVVRQSAFYREWVEPQDLHDACLTKVGESGNCVVQLSVVNSRAQGAVRASQQDLVRRLAPHLRRAIMIGELAARQQTLLAQQGAALDALRCGVLLTDGAGKVHHANTAAAAQMAQGTFLRLRAGHLTAAANSQQAALADALARAHQGDVPLGTRGIGIPVRASGGGCCVLYILPLNQSAARHLNGGATVAVYLSAAADAVPLLDAVLQTLYGLTAREAHLVRQACEGGSVRELARRTRLSENTVKTHLKRAFDKTGVHRRSDLVALVADLLPPVTWAAPAGAPSHEDRLAPTTRVSQG